MSRKIALIFAAMWLSLLGGCIKENTSDCNTGLILRFNYRFGDHSQADLEAQVGIIRVYIFDENKVLNRIIPISTSSLVGGSIRADIPAGIYTFVAIGFSGNDMLNGGYQDADITMPATQNFTTPVVIGTTTIESFRVMLKTKTATAIVTPDSYSFDDMYYAGAENIQVAESSSQQFLDFSFIDDCNILDITLDGLQYIPAPLLKASEPPVRVFLTGNNGWYDYQNKIDSFSPVIQFEPPYKTLDTSSMTIDIKTLRLDIVYHTINPIYLHVINTQTATNMIKPLDIVTAILQLKDNNGQIIYNTQDDIDKQRTFVFKLSVALDLSVKVTINGFVVENIGAGLSQ